jgi:hypothetical protein
MARLRRSTAWIALFVSLYALSVAAIPALHCDFDCHFKTPSHCQACVASALAPAPAAPLAVWAGPLPLAGDAPSASVVAQPRTIEIDLPGRAPPA